MVGVSTRALVFSDNIKESALTGNYEGFILKL